MRFGAKGVRVQVGGRLGGAEMSRREWEREGRVPLHTLRADIDFGQAEAHTTFGVIGVKAWIYRGDVAPDRAAVTEGVAAGATAARGRALRAAGAAPQAPARRRRRGAACQVSALPLRPLPRRAAAPAAASRCAKPRPTPRRPPRKRPAAPDEPTREPRHHGRAGRHAGPSESRGVLTCCNRSASSIARCTAASGAAWR